jgi:hypothetical protein
MTDPINLDSQSQFTAIKIYDIIANRFLPKELVALDLSAFDLLP